MIVIPPEFLGCCIYIYPSEESAKSGKLSVGGSGFLVGVPLKENTSYIQFYAVTNRHVIEKIPNPVLRLNTYAGKFECLKTNRLRWKNHDGADSPDDLAVCPIEIDPKDHDFIPIIVDGFIDQEIKAKWLYPGDEVFMIGRFFSQEGTDRNTPSVRFGNISMLPVEPMKNRWGNDQDAYLVEHRSLPGYSGSPVFVYIDPSKPRPPEWHTPVHARYRPEFHGPWLLGIDFCHINDFEPVRQDDEKKTIADPKQWVKSHTGMAGVIPAWKVLELLNTDELRMQREKDDAEITAHNKSSHLTFDSRSDDSEEVEQLSANFSQSDFESALRKVSRKITPEK